MSSSGLIDLPLFTKSPFTTQKRNGNSSSNYRLSTWKKFIALPAPQIQPEPDPLISTHISLPYKSFGTLKFFKGLCLTTL
ncbi:unnamed protein product [Citrullus colocynthis]|uniref:Uncharacterized protein n=1 Tax=Citrullus colocynthis TaxID=252529 RepID=A0ABP0XUW4_9ROSI